jgi:AcrR family transcriptional regulator
VVSTNAITEQVDLRVRRTHKLLWEALLAELSARPFEDITVSAICERAMVHRTTFYKHYADKYDLLEKGVRNIYASLIGSSEHLPPIAYAADNPPPYFVRLFEHAAEHERFYRAMLAGAGVHRFQQLLRDSILEFASMQRVDAPHYEGTTSVPLSLHAQFMAGGTLSVLSWWLEQGRPFSPYQMAGYLVQAYRA